MSTPSQHTPSPEEFVEVSLTPEFQQLRKTFRGFAFPMTIGFLAWYVFYIVTATFATDLVKTEIYGAINLGMVLGLAQFATAGLVTWAYVSFADNKSILPPKLFACRWKPKLRNQQQ